MAQPRTGIAMPESNGDTMEEVPGTYGRVRRGMQRFVQWLVKIVSSASPPKVSATRRMKSAHTKRQTERMEESLCLTGHLEGMAQGGSSSWRARPGVEAVDPRVCC